jgi:hypothetical protein
VNAYQLNDEFNGWLAQAITATGASLKRSAAEVALYTAQRAAHLATLAGQPGFEEAVIAERDAVALFAGVKLVEEADAADARFHGLIEGVLAVAAKAAAGAA